MSNLKADHSKQVGKWLLIGVGMIIIQILLGGITRLTESGLSITEWNPITGALPPMNDTQWLAEFDKYKNTGQFRYIHADFTLSDFKTIFFWEWMHRLWARLMGMVFLAGFVFFLVKKRFKKEMVIPMIILFLLGALQGTVGWIMVKSGLVPEKMFVGHIQLTTHFIAAIILFCYSLWFALSLLVLPSSILINKKLQRFSVFIAVIFLLQFVYGAFMAGLKAGPAAPTWPDINGKLLPALSSMSPWLKNITDNPITVQFIHRGLAYIILILVILWYLAARKRNESALFTKTRWLLPATVSLQVILGIVTVLTSIKGNNLLYFGVAHQFVAMLLVIEFVWIIYLVRGSGKIT